LETVLIDAPVPLRDSLTKEYEMHDISGFTVYLERLIVAERTEVLNVLQVDLEAVSDFLLLSSHLYPAMFRLLDCSLLFHFNSCKHTPQYSSMHLLSMGRLLHLSMEDICVITRTEELLGLNLMDSVPLRLEVSR
jgi:hypothetical protein